MKPGSRETLLIAIAKARRWIKEVERGQSFADIARREGKAERHVRHLARLAFVSPRIITAVIDGNAPAGLTVASFTRSLPYCWAKQERKISIRHGGTLFRTENRDKQRVSSHM
jgi:site-specific DNA recombinase